MADASLPLLRGRTTASDFRPVVGGPRSASPPRPDPATHRTKLLGQLDGILAAAASRPPGQRDAEASREVIAIRPADPSVPLAADQLGDTSGDVRIVGADPMTGTVLLDAPGPELPRLREKAAEFGEPKARKTKDGGTSISPAHMTALGPVAEIALASETDLQGPRLRAWVDERGIPAEPVWFELACRGGYRNPSEWTKNSRVQVYRQLDLLGIKPQEFEAPEELDFFVRLTLEQLRALVSAVDCIFAYDVVPSEVLTWLLLKEPPTRAIRSFTLTPPADGAPSVVLLDTGVATEHPLLKNALLGPLSVVEGISSPEDTYGHGTKMAGAALYADLGKALEQGSFQATHWIQSVRILVEPGKGSASEENRPYWPRLTVDAVARAERDDDIARRRAYALAVTFRVTPLLPTSWAQAVDQLAYNGGNGRLLCVSAGNVRPEDMFATANAYPESLFQWKIHEPGQGSNSLTVGAFTAKTTLPPDPDYAEAKAVAPAGGAAPHTTTGIIEAPWPIKPDLVLEGGNIALSTLIADPDAETLVTLTTGHRHLTKPLSWISMTSEAAARAARMAVDVWKENPELRPETVRGLLVHSASWTSAMREQFGDPDLFHACGYGVPDVSFAKACASNRATVIVEDSIHNAVVVQRPKKTPPKRASTPATEEATQRVMKVFRMPAPDELLLATPDVDVELRVTLSYFAEPSTFRTRVEHGMNLKWDMQGPQEEDDEFLERINDLLRPRDGNGKAVKKQRKKSFPWEIGVNRRSRGTVQSDRWRGKASMLAGAKLISVYPVLGWWDRRPELATKEMPFTLIVSIVADNIYAAVQAELAATVPISI